MNLFFTILFFAFMFISMLNLVHLGLYLIGANFYDIKTFRTQRRKSGWARHNPKVSVLIPAHNEEAGIVRCLESVRRSTIRDLEIIVIDDASTDHTVQVVQEYIRKRIDFTRPVTLLKVPKNGGKANALNFALRRGLKGDFVMTLDADSILHPRAIQNAIEYFYDDPTVAGVAANVKVMHQASVLSLVQQFEYMVGYRSKKFYTATNCEFIVGGVASTYRYDILKDVGFYDSDLQTEDIALSLKVASLGNKSFKLVYGADVVAMTEGVQTFKSLLRQRYRWKLGSLQGLFKYRSLLLNSDSRYSRSLTWYRIPMAFLGEIIVLVEPLMIAYIVYLSFLVMSPQAFIGAYGLITGYILWNLLPDEHLPFKQKVRLLPYVPLMYFLFYIMNIVQFYAITKVLWNYRQAIGLAPTSGTWVSPERAKSAHVGFSA